MYIVYNVIVNYTRDMRARGFFFRRARADIFKEVDQ